MDGFFFGFDLQNVQNQGKLWVRNMSRVVVSLSMQQMYIYIYNYIIYIMSYIDISLYIYTYIYNYTVHISMTLHWATFIRWLLEPKYTSPDTYLVAVYLEMPTAYILPGEHPPWMQLRPQREVWDVAGETLRSRRLAEDRTVLCKATAECCTYWDNDSHPGEDRIWTVQRYSHFKSF